MAKIGLVYAKALYELAAQKEDISAIEAQLRGFWETCEAHTPLRAALTGATVDVQNRMAILKEISDRLGVQGLSRRLLELMASKGRLSLLPQVIEELEALIAAAQGVRAGEVRTAVELSQEELNVLGAALAGRVGGKVRLTQKVDPALLGGVVATVAGKTFDASLRTQMERFRNELI